MKTTSLILLFILSVGIFNSSFAQQKSSDTKNWNAKLGQYISKYTTSIIIKIDELKKLSETATIEIKNAETGKTITCSSFEIVVVPQHQETLTTKISGNHFGNEAKEQIKNKMHGGGTVIIKDVHGTTSDGETIAANPIVFKVR